MKKGSGDDLLSDIDTNEEDESGAEDESESESEHGLDDDVLADIDEPTTQEIPSADDDVPYLLRRNRVKEERETVGFGLQRETRDLENDVLRDLQTELGVENLPATDLREAAYLAGLQNPDRIREILLEWGYEYRM